MDKIVHITGDEAIEVTNRWGLGNFNDVPIGWEEIAESEYVKNTLTRMYTPKYRDYKQIRWPDKTSLFPVVLSLFHDGTGTAVHYDYWGEKIRYFRFGCRHNYVTLSQNECRERGILHHGRQWHVNECKNCGYIDSYDSSD